tara:strand:- start:227 stop:484 length:258 start_codon:yes stop_codon:yes gene_type:complete
LWLGVNLDAQIDIGFASLLKVELVFTLQLFGFELVSVGIDLSKSRVYPAGFTAFHFWRSMQAIKPAAAVMMQMIGNAKSMVSLSR